jgi:geranylgeranyl diphosphate synthase type I
MILESGFPINKINNIMKILSLGYKDVNESQILDLAFEYYFPDIDEWDVMVCKRAASLFKTSILTGAILASAPSKDIKILEDVANHIGKAFDIQDDLIDTFATREQYGRTPGRDIIKKKKPAHLILAFQNNEKARSIMKNHARINEKNVIEIKNIIVESGSREKINVMIKKHIEKANEIISKTSMLDESKLFFSLLLDYINDSLEWYK